MLQRLIIGQFLRLLRPLKVGVTAQWWQKKDIGI
jgi:hypothetical protein